MKPRQREEAVRLRLAGQLGYGEIAKKVGVSKSTLSRWLQDMPLSKDRLSELRKASWSRGEEKRERFRETMRLKREERDLAMYEAQKKKFKSISTQAVFVAGLMLYAAEGDKKSRAEIAFANTDSAMVLFFARWLEQFLGIGRERLRAQLHLYEDMDISAEERYWARELGFRPTQLVKSQIRPIRPGSFTYRESFRHGTCKLYVGGVLKKTELMLSIRAFFDTHDRQTHA